jgi:hypothetical protein
MQTPVRQELLARNTVVALEITEDGKQREFTSVTCCGIEYSRVKVFERHRKLIPELMPYMMDDAEDPFCAWGTKKLMIATTNEFDAYTDAKNLVPVKVFNWKNETYPKYKKNNNPNSRISKKTMAVLPVLYGVQHEEKMLYFVSLRNVVEWLTERKQRASPFGWKKYVFVNNGDSWLSCESLEIFGIGQKRQRQDDASVDEDIPPAKMQKTTGLCTDSIEVEMQTVASAADDFWISQNTSVHVDACIEEDEQHIDYDQDLDLLTADELCAELPEFTMDFDQDASVAHVERAMMQMQKKINEEVPTVAVDSGSVVAEFSAKEKGKSPHPDESILEQPAQKPEEEPRVDNSNDENNFGAVSDMTQSMPVLPAMQSGQSPCQQQQDVQSVGSHLAQSLPDAAVSTLMSAPLPPDANDTLPPPPASHQNDFYNTDFGDMPWNEVLPQSATTQDEHSNSVAVPQSFDIASSLVVEIQALRAEVVKLREQNEKACEKLEVAERLYQATTPGLLIALNEFKTVTASMRQKYDELKRALDEQQQPALDAITANDFFNEIMNTSPGGAWGQAANDLVI